MNPEDQNESAAAPSSQTTLEKLHDTLPRFENVVGFVFIYAILFILLFVILDLKIFLDLSASLSLVLVVIAGALCAALNTRSNDNGGGLEELTWKLVFSSKLFIIFTIADGALLSFLVYYYRPFKSLSHDYPYVYIALISSLYMLPILFSWGFPLSRRQKFYFSLGVTLALFGIQILMILLGGALAMLMGFVIAVGS